MVIGGELPDATSATGDTIGDVEQERETIDTEILKKSGPYPTRTKFSDNLEARIVMVKC